MTITYAATPDDVRALTAYALRHSRRYTLTLAAYALAIALVWLFPDLLAHRVSLHRALIVAGLAVLAVFVGLPWLAGVRTKRGRRSVTVGQAGIETRIEGLAATIPWERIMGIWQTAEHVFIMRTNLNGFAIPNRAFDSDAAKAQFLQICREYRQRTSTTPRRAA